MKIIEEARLYEYEFRENVHAENIQKILLPQSEILM